MVDKKKPGVIYDKPLNEWTNADVENFVSSYKHWIMSHPSHVTFSQFCKSVGIKNPYQLKDYLIKNFTGSQNTIDFMYIFAEAEKIREDKLVELGLFNKNVNAQFLLGLMKSRFGWHDNTVVVGISMDDIQQAKERAVGKK